MMPSHEKQAHESQTLTAPLLREGNADDYHWLSVATQDCAFLGILRGYLGDRVEFFVSRTLTQVQRVPLDGTWMLRGRLRGHVVALLWSDFRVKGGSFGKDVSLQLNAFLDSLQSSDLPLLIKISSLGVRFMEGRTVFEPAFSILPAIDRYRRRHLVMTLGHGNILGIGALVYGLGQYRVAVKEDTYVNLTGPEVCRMVFGSGLHFEDIAATETQFRQTDLIHELVPDLPAALDRVAVLLATFNISQRRLYHLKGEEDAVPLPTDACATTAFVTRFSDSTTALFCDYDDRLQCFIGSIDGQKFGILINRIGNANNMIRVRSLALFAEALTLFKFLKLPVLSLLDTPGADPRMDGNNRQLIEKFLAVAEQIIQYPFGKLGIVIGRAYGGACVLGFPKVFGSRHVFALEGASIGIMHEKIIDHLLAGSAKLKEQWNEVAQTQTQDLYDLIETGAVDVVIREHEMRHYIQRYLLEPYSQQKQTMRRLSTL